MRSSTISSWFWFFSPSLDGIVPTIAPTLELTIAPTIEPTIVPTLFMVFWFSSGGYRVDGP